MNWMLPLLVMVCMLLVGCGGGGIADLAAGGQGGTGVTGGGQGGTGMSAGTVTAFGSIHVNGVRYDTSQAEIFVEGQSQGFGDGAVQTSLAVGMVVRVEGNFEDSENGTADRVYFNDDLRGLVETGSFQEIDSLTSKLVVLGKTVVINEFTNVVGIAIDSGIEGEWIQVSGFEDAEGRLNATFVTGITNSGGANLKGTITAVDPPNFIITINGIDISYLNAAPIDPDPFAVGQLVEVTGDYSSGAAAVDADNITWVDFLGADDIDFIELEGIVSNKTSDTEFSLNGVPVILNAQTIYSGGDAGDAAEDVRIEVEGQLIDGVVHAETVIFLDFAKVEADVAANTASVISLHGLMDIPIRCNDLTKVTGAVTAVADIDNTLHVKIIGRRLSPMESETVLAVHIITLSPLNDKVILQGALEGNPPADPSSITLLDHDVDISAVPDDSFESPGGVGYAAFHASTQAGDIVSAKGTRSGGIVTWQSMTVE
ncbi:MAG TPA: DUF5666 domain-containing protein [Desulfosarcina sp.]|nr:DUF5666 domain-containing protein [Desulfosarcina sp.]